MKVTIKHTVTPRYGDALKENQEQETHPTGRVVIEKFEHIDSTLVIMKKRNIRRDKIQKDSHWYRAALLYLCDVWKSNHIGHQADNSNENLSSASKYFGEFIHKGSDEAFNSAELKDTITGNSLKHLQGCVYFIHQIFLYVVVLEIF